MKNTLVIGPVLGLSAISFGYGGGTGEPNDPYQIGDVNDLLELAADVNDYNKCFIMTADINLAGYDFNNAVIGYVEGQDIAFSGIFDGNEHKISNLTIDSNIEYNSLGLFYGVAYGGEIRNLGLENVKITGIGHGGALAAGIDSSTIINCYSTVDIN